MCDQFLSNHCVEGMIMTARCFFFFLVLQTNVSWVTAASSSTAKTARSAATIVVVRPKVPANMSCDFEDGHLCGWTADQDNGLTWIVTNASNYDGIVDHTNHSAAGHVLTTVGKSHVEERASFSSGTLPKGFFCVLFYLRTLKKDAANVIVYKIVNNLRIPLDRTDHKHFPDWEPIQVTVSISKKDSYFVTIESHQYSGTIGQVFLDDIQVTRGKCQPLPTAPTTRTTTATTTTKTTPTTPTTTTTTPQTPTITDTTKTSSPSITARPTVRTGDNKQPGPDDNWKIAAGAGAGVFILVVAVVITIVWRRKRRNGPKKHRHSKGQNGETSRKSDEEVFHTFTNELYGHYPASDA